MQKFQRLNLIGGIAIGIFATLIYSLTMAPSSSLWDCGEFIAAAYKQMVVHPPGSPLFLMIGRVFTLMAPSPEYVAVTMNFMSALSSGLAMMFLFWITTYMARKAVVGRDGEWDNTKMYLILAAGAVGALTGTFLDSIWFSAVEAEVYSMSLLFTAAVFWLATKWETVADEPHADRYLVLIAFLQGCSIFVHWLNLLSIPAIALVYYFRRYDPTIKGFLLTMITAVGILVFFLNGIITGVVDFLAAFELYAVNSMGLPFNTGLIAAVIVIVTALTAGILFTRRKGWAGAQNALLAVMFILIGYSTITATVIRSNAEPAIDMNSPRDIASLASYLHREQYGSRPLLTGHYYDQKPTGSIDIGDKYKKGKKRYDKVGKKIDYTYGNQKTHFFPRIHVNGEKARYERWLGKKKNSKPTASDNWRFFAIYQINHMYFRYFMWNFAGRQNDVQGTETAQDGNWISGIPLIDNWRTVFFGSTRRMPYQASFLPDHVKNDPSRNTYYMIPFFLVVLGFLYQARNDKRRFVITLFLFLFTGVALIIYGNSPPIEPRERDYIFAASFYTAAIWAGLGVIAIFRMIQKFLSGSISLGVAVVIGLLSPLLLCTQNWDDHDRSGRYAARDFAKNYLETCAPNAILFTQGDNDTYPLWYAQEVEGIRRDVRVVNLSLLGVDWYINQNRRKLNDAEATPFTLGPEKINGTARDYVLFRRDARKAPDGRFIELKKLMEFIGNDKNALPTQGGASISHYPTQTISLPVDKQKLIANGTVHPDDVDLIVDKMEVTLQKENLYKPDLMILDIIAANNWERPIYFAVSVDRRSFNGFEDYFQLEGLAYRLVPIKAPEDDRSPYKGRVQTDIMYDNLMNKFSFGDIDKPGVSVSSDIDRMAQNFRMNYNRLADALVQEGKNDKAVEVMDKAMSFLPNDKHPYDSYIYSSMLNYYDAGAPEKGNEVLQTLVDNMAAESSWIAQTPPRYRKGRKRDYERNQSLLNQFILLLKEYKQPEMAEKVSAQIADLPASSSLFAK